MDYKLQIVVLLTVGFGLASLLGVLAQKIRLPSILGFLVAGYCIGPFSPGFVADTHTAEQLAEIGVILMLFGVGLHFKLQDLLNVKNIAIPGALIQTAIASAAGFFVMHEMGWTASSGLIIGLAISVASTVVLVRALTDNQLLDTVQGHIAVGWLIVEDLLTVAILVLLPLMALFFEDGALSPLAISGSIIFLLAKFALLTFILFKWGHILVAYLLTSVARLRSQELFTLSVLALTFVIATGAAFVFGTSIALGAFLAGMVIGQTDVRHQALANALPLKDVFSVLFFLSIGMLFNPLTIAAHSTLFFGILAIILLVKPLAALLIVLCLKYPLKVALTVAVALAQIGEFSFILAEQAMHHKLLPDEGYDILVACAFVSISLNPLLFSGMLFIEEKFSKFQALYGTKRKGYPEKISSLFEQMMSAAPQVVVVGFGPIGEAVTQALEQLDIVPVIVEQNIDSIVHMKDENRQLIYGDASVPNILQITQITKANLLVLTIPELKTTLSIIKSARHLNPKLHILARITYANDIARIQEMDVDYVCAEEETAKALVDKTVKAVGFVQT